MNKMVIDEIKINSSRDELSDIGQTNYVVGCRVVDADPSSASNNVPQYYAATFTEDKADYILFKSEEDIYPIMVGDDTTDTDKWNKVYAAEICGKPAPEDEPVFKILKHLLDVGYEEADNLADEYLGKIVDEIAIE